jgi:fumarylacetoacetase
LSRGTGSPELDETHDAALRSWVESANDGRTDFPIQNLPFGRFLTRGEGDRRRMGVAIGDQIVDLAAVHEAGLLRGITDDVHPEFFHQPLNALMGAGPEMRRGLRMRLSELLREGNDELRRDPRIAASLIPMKKADLKLPAQVPDYTDFYAGIEHAQNVGRMLRPDEPLLSNYKYVPIAYHGRASSVVVSGTPFHRPNGQTKPDDAAAPSFGPTRALDYELEVAVWVGNPNPPGFPVSIAKAERHIFGVGLLNDWSARDIQTWEYRPLGPFLAKSFATTVSPWIVTLEALAPFRAPAYERPEGDPQPLPYLSSDADRARGGIDLMLDVHLQTRRMREQSVAPVRLSRVSFRHMYWTPAQMVTHHASNGCNLRPGDLLGSGTVSGPEPDSRGSLLELTRRGSEPIDLPTGEVRRFLEDGDEVVLRGWCEREGFARIGLGECRGLVLAPFVMTATGQFLPPQPRL